MSKFKKALIIILISTILGYAIGVGITFAQDANMEIVERFTNQLALIFLGVGFIAGCGFSLSLKPSKEKKTKNEGETAKGDKMEIAHDARFITAKELRGDPELLFTTWQQLPTVTKTGFVFRNKIIGNHLEINMSKESHALVIGTTGTGKTQVLADPTIRIFAHSAEKPSMIIADPKGELYEDNANVLKKEGYNVIVLNLEDPYSSSKWNPMEIAYKTYEKATHLEKEVKKFSNCTPESVGYKKFSEAELDGVKYGDTWFGFEGKAFPNNDILKIELEARRAQLDTEAKSILRNIAIALIPVLPDNKDPVWASGCQDLILGIMEGMLEDSRNPELGMTLDKFNFFNLYKIAMLRDSATGNDSQVRTLSRFAEGRDRVKSNVYELMSSVCGASPVTLKSFLATLGSSIGRTLADDGILYMTSGTDVDFEDIPERPTAFFLRIPDHKTERHPIGVLCIQQLYKVLVDIANTTVNPKTGKKGQLKRKVYFILDEFGNLPPVQGFGTMVTVSRSRNIFFEIILQSYKQLDIKYGAEEAQNIRGNFQTEIFLGSEDPSTIQAFSEACGEITVFHEEESESKAEKSDQGKSVSKSMQRTRRPLIDKSELRTMEKFTAVVKIFRKPVLREKMTPFFEASMMEKSPAQAPVSLAKQLEYDKISYDIEERNRKVLKPRNPFDI